MPLITVANSSNSISKMLQLYENWTPMKCRSCVSNAASAKRTEMPP